METTHISPPSLSLCEDHWKQLKAQVETFGLGQFISKNGQQLQQRMSKIDSPFWDRGDFDPLLFANLAIIKNAIDNDRSVLTANRCPICLLETPDWIECAAEDAYSEAVRLGLVASS